MISLPKETERTCNRAKVLNACLSQIRQGRIRLQRSRDQNEVLLGQTCRTRAYLHGYRGYLNASIHQSKIQNQKLCLTSNYLIAKLLMYP